MRLEIRCDKESWKFLQNEVELNWPSEKRAVGDRKAEVYKPAESYRVRARVAA